MIGIKKTILITGATATGKSALAMALARQAGLGIISADSMQVYKYLDIASAKPTKEERKLVPHAGIDLAEPTQNFSVAQWLDAVESVFKAMPGSWLVTGGSGLYVKAFLHGLDDLPESPQELRQKWENAGLEKAVKELKRLSPEISARVDLSNLRRVVRAIVLLELGINPMCRSFFRESRDVLHIHLKRDPVDLRNRIISRTRKMFEMGLVEEFRMLVDKGLRPGHTAWQAIGMDALRCLCEGRVSQPEAIEMIATKTWQFSRRQRTWFRKTRGMEILEIESNCDEDRIFKKAMEIIQRHAQ
jgi:tRNA dimethylallyltransferase